MRHGVCLLLLACRFPSRVAGFVGPATPAHQAPVAAATKNDADAVAVEVDAPQGALGRRQLLVAAVATAVEMNPGTARSDPGVEDERVPPSLLVASAAAPVPAVDARAILGKSFKKAVGGGKAGAAAAVVQVCSLMWLRTSMNYQYRFGGTLQSSLQELYSEGGIPRLYQGLPFAIFQGPLTRFGDTAANVGVLALLESLPETAQWPLPLKTAAGSLTAGLWRIVLMPIDTSKTCLQVEGAAGLDRLKQRVVEGGPAPLYQGALASAAATAAGHFPWFLTYNFLSERIPAVSREDALLLFLVRAAALGLAASCVSDCTSNSLRVIKTTKQTAGLGDDATEEISYRAALALVLEKDGVPGLLGRGLQTRLLTNAIQGALFSVLWKYFQTMPQ